MSSLILQSAFIKNISTLEKLTITDVKEYFQKYATGKLHSKDKTRTSKTINICKDVIFEFLSNLLNDSSINMTFKEEDLFYYKTVRNKYGKLVKKKLSVFDIEYYPTFKQIYRDIPTEAVELIIDHIRKHHKDLLMVITLQCFAGLRPSEAMNVRREDSPLGKGIIYTIENNNVSNIQIDIRYEYNLRSDQKSVGKIKKERIQVVPAVFINVFTDLYREYLLFIKDSKYENDYGPLNLNKQGKALTYSSYYQRFRKIINDEMIPIFLNSGDSRIINFGLILQEVNISPHIFRHWYTVQLVLQGYQIHELMNARGDSSTESSLTYLKNKGELSRVYEYTNNILFESFYLKAKEGNSNESE